MEEKIAEEHKNKILNTIAHTIFEGDYKKAVKFIAKFGGCDEVNKIMQNSITALKCIAMDAEMRIAALKRELEDNEEYCEAKEVVKTLTQGFRDTTKKDAATKRLCAALIKSHEDRDRE